MIYFLVSLILVAGFLYFKSDGKILINDIFWLAFFWVFIIGVYCFSGVRWKYAMTYRSILLIFLCFSFYIIGRRFGKKKKTKLFVRKPKNNKDKLFTLVGVIGILLFVVDFFRNNGFGGSIIKSSYKISIIGSIGTLLIPILLVQGLSYIADSLNTKGKFSIKGILLLLAYTVPCILNSGRESILYVIIGVVSLLGYKNCTNKKKLSIRHIGRKKLFRIILIVVIVCVAFGIIIKISGERFGSTEINTYLNKHDVSESTIAEAESWGNYKFLYYNFLSYFGHQIPFLEFVIREYHGPHLFGMYELNIISRRLPAFLNLDYELVYTQLRALFKSTGETFSGAWQTVLGSFIIDFSLWLTPIVCLGCGYVVGIIKRKFERSLDMRYGILMSLVCLSTFSTIQLGPFYNIFVYGSYIWWVIIYKKGEQYTKKS